MQTAFSEAAERNKQPILEKLHTLFASSTSVLEIGSGSGQHAVYFASALPHLTWQPTELPDKLQTLLNRCRLSSLENLAFPLELNIDSNTWPDIRADAVFTANTLHIIHWPQVRRLFTQIGHLLPENRLFCVYGPFNQGGRYSSESNAQFDLSLKNRDPESGIRDIDDLQRLAERCNLSLTQNYAMPANNRLLVWQKN